MTKKSYIEGHINDKGKQGTWIEGRESPPHTHTGSEYKGKYGTDIEAYRNTYKDGEIVHSEKATGWDKKHTESGGGGSSGGGSGGGGCFITTATLTSIGKTDNCKELNVFRDFRDNWLAKQPDGQWLISDYYKIAPRIVTAINSIDDSEKIYRQLWTDSIKPCLILIKQNRFTDAKTIYCNVVADLKQKFLDK